jgi:hypothetical protein
MGFLSRDNDLEESPTPARLALSSLPSRPSVQFLFLFSFFEQKIAKVAKEE